ncbi:thioesterase II family protein [Streptomyces sp. NPDC127159]|uniref:thioesterase II family protein n=1 Tax=unclassified Streptomyces TaxID=2593676 RepID=UPI00363B9434
MTDHRQPSDPAAWLHRIGTSAAGPTLVLFPHAGGSASFYQGFSLANGFGQTFAVQYPGHGERLNEPLVASIPELAEMIEPVLSNTLEHPLVLFGHSFGALVAFEVALRLEKQGTPPTALFASGRRAPSCRRSEVETRFSDPELLVQHLVALGGTDDRITADPEMLGMVQPILQNDFKAATEYMPGPGTAVDVPLFCALGREDPEVTLDEGRSWVDHTLADFRIRVFNGKHFYFLDQLRLLCRWIEECVDDVNDKIRRGETR